MYLFVDLGISIVIRTNKNYLIPFYNKPKMSDGDDFFNLPRSPKSIPGRSI